MLNFRPCYLLYLILVMGLACVVPGIALAIDLPAPTALMSKYNLKSQTITVIEPHESKQGKQVIVDYQVLAMTDLLTKWFGDNWRSADAEIVFLAQDGYRSVVDGSKLGKYRAFLAFARADGLPFKIDNVGQNQYQVPLRPYYLIWDNQGNPELLRQGAYGWPYQIKTITIQGVSENQPLLPPKRTPYLDQGLADAKSYCLTCHHIQGVGGNKYPPDLLQAACRWTDKKLKDFIESPNRFKPDATMPPLARMLPDEERRAIIGRLVDYLRSMQKKQHLECHR